MSTRAINEVWDAAAEEKSWRESMEKARQGQDMFKKTGAEASGFYVLCLSELDAGIQLSKPEYFVSRAAFIAGCRSLLIEPTTPSRPVPSVEAYRQSQKLWLEFIIGRYEKAAPPDKSSLISPVTAILVGSASLLVDAYFVWRTIANLLAGKINTLGKGTHRLVFEQSEPGMFWFQISGFFLAEIMIAAGAAGLLFVGFKQLRRL